jgi:hypothetical protein
MPRLTSLHLKMIFTTYKSDVHPTLTGGICESGVVLTAVRRHVRVPQRVSRAAGVQFFSGGAVFVTGTPRVLTVAARSGGCQPIEQARESLVRVMSRPVKGTWSYSMMAGRRCGRPGSTHGRSL